MVREIVELKQLNREDPSRLKTHDEILKLIKEIESIEDKFKYLETTPDKGNGKEIVNQELEKTEEKEELTGKSYISADQTKSELKGRARSNNGKDNKRKIRFPIEINWRKDIKRPKIGNFLKRIKINSSGIKTQESTELQNQVEISGVGLRSLNTTFTLRVNDEGRLIGYNIKKPKSEGGHRRILPFRKGNTEESKDKETGEPGIKGKFIGLFSRIKPKKSGGSKLSSLLGKIKDVLPKR